MISADSVQGKFTSRYYRNQHQHLDADIAASLQGLAFETREDKPFGKQQLFPVGTVAMVRPTERGKYRRAYLVAIAELNNQGRAHGTMEDLRSAMGALWSYISDRGDIEPLRVPILGTGFSRLTEQRT